jgi:hypothetical protein
MSDIDIWNERIVGVGHIIVHAPFQEGVLREVDVTKEVVELFSSYVFWGSDENKVHLSDVIGDLPRLNARLQRAVDEFKSTHLKNAVGFHMRRTDQFTSRKYSPDELFFKRAETIIGAGKKIFLATDNTRTEEEMCKKFGDNVITYQKRQRPERRWPRLVSYDPIAIEDDLIDLFLLANTEYVIGSYWSSYSGVAMALNGSKKCEIIKAQESAEIKVI